MKNFMPKYFIFVICIIVSFFIGKQTSYNTKIGKEEKELNEPILIKNEKIIHTEIQRVTSLPLFLQKELKKFNIQMPLTKEKWDLLLKYIKQDSISELNYKSINSLAFHAIEANDINYLKYLAKNDPSFNINQKNQLGNTLLMEAFKSSSLNIITELINLNANLYETTDRGKDLLNFALENKINLLKIKFLIENGFNFDNSTKYFRELNLPHNKKLLLKYSKNIDFNKTSYQEQDLFESMMKKQNDEYTVTQILEANDIQPQDGYNALHIASGNKNYSIKLIEKLIKKGFDVNSQMNSTKQTPLMGVIAKGYIEKVKYLLSNGAKLDIKDWKENDIFYYVDKIKDSTKKTEIINLINQYSKD